MCVELESKKKGRNTKEKREEQVRVKMTRTGKEDGFEASCLIDDAQAVIHCNPFISKLRKVIFTLAPDRLPFHPLISRVIDCPDGVGIVWAYHPSCRNQHTVRPGTPLFHASLKSGDTEPVTLHLSLSGRYRG